MRIVSKTDVGLARRTNQDAYATGELPGGVAWAVVCDGMGGVGGGNVASALAVKTISEQISSSYREGMSSNSVRTLLESAITAANMAVFDKSQQETDLAGMGTTVVVCVILDGKAHISHVGDSRAYVFSPLRIRQITRDHSYVQRLIEDGKLTEEEARTYPHRNIITRALGVEERLLVDYNEVTLAPEDAILICTDGLSGSVEEGEMLEVIRQSNVYECPDRLVRLANEKGGADNVTVVILSL